MRDSIRDRIKEVVNRVIGRPVNEETLISLKSEVEKIFRYPIDVNFSMDAMGTCVNIDAAEMGECSFEYNPIDIMTNTTRIRDVCGQMARNNPNQNSLTKEEIDLLICCIHSAVKEGLWETPTEIDNLDETYISILKKLGVDNPDLDALARYPD